MYTESRHKSVILKKNAYNFTRNDTLQRFPNKIGEVSKIILNDTLTIKPGFSTLRKTYLRGMTRLGLFMTF